MGTAPAFHTWLNQWLHVSLFLEVTVKLSKIMKGLYNQPVRWGILRISAHRRCFTSFSFFFPVFLDLKGQMVRLKNGPSLSSVHQSAYFYRHGGGHWGPSQWSPGERSPGQVIIARGPHSSLHHAEGINQSNVLVLTDTSMQAWKGPGSQAFIFTSAPSPAHSPWLALSHAMPRFPTVQRLTGVMGKSDLTCEQKLFIVVLRRDSRDASSGGIQSEFTLSHDSHISITLLRLYPSTHINPPKNKRTEKKIRAWLEKIYSGCSEECREGGGFAVSGWWPERQNPPCAPWKTTLITEKM